MVKKNIDGLSYFNHLKRQLLLLLDRTAHKIVLIKICHFLLFRKDLEKLNIPEQNSMKPLLSMVIAKNIVIV